MATTTIVPSVPLYAERRTPLGISPVTFTRE
jgi:hypothetical protein